MEENILSEESVVLDVDELATVGITNNTVLDETMTTYKSGLPVKIAHKIVFKQYIDLLNRKVINDIGPQNYHVYTSKKIPDIGNLNCVTDTTLRYIIGRNNVYDINNVTTDNILFEIINKFKIKDVCTLNDSQYLSVADDMVSPSEITYQSLLNIPASGYLFTTNNHNVPKFISSDWNYKSLNYVPTNWALTRRSYNKLLADYNFDFNYWYTNYNFASGYDSDEYDMFNIKQSFMHEKISMMDSSDLRVQTGKDASKIEAISVVWHHPNSENNLKVPVLYAELHKGVRPVDGYVNIVWSSNGLITVE